MTTGVSQLFLLMQTYKRICESIQKSKCKSVTSVTKEVCKMK